MPREVSLSDSKCWNVGHEWVQEASNSVPGGRSLSRTPAEPSTILIGEAPRTILLKKIVKLIMMIMKRFNIMIIGLNSVTVNVNNRAGMHKTTIS